MASSVVATMGKVVVVVVEGLNVPNKKNTYIKGEMNIKFVIKPSK